MKKLLLAPVIVILIGCGQKSPYDITPAQAQAHSQAQGHGMMPGGGGAIATGPGGQIDLNHLPPGAVKTEKTFKKGDKLPNGQIADKDTKLVLVKIEKPGSGPNGGTDDRKIQILTDGKP